MLVTEPSDVSCIVLVLQVQVQVSCSDVVMY